MSANGEDFDSNPPPIFLTEVDKQVLAQTDEEFHYQTWEDLKQIICILALINLQQQLMTVSFRSRQSPRDPQAQTL